MLAPKGRAGLSRQNIPKRSLLSQLRAMGMGNKRIPIAILRKGQ